MITVPAAHVHIEPVKTTVTHRARGFAQSVTAGVLRQFLDTEAIPEHAQIEIRLDTHGKVITATWEG